MNKYKYETSLELNGTKHWTTLSKNTPLERQKLNQSFQEGGKPARHGNMNNGVRECMKKTCECRRSSARNASPDPGIVRSPHLDGVKRAVEVHDVHGDNRVLLAGLIGTRIGKLIKQNKKNVSRVPWRVRASTLG